VIPQPQNWQQQRQALASILIFDDPARHIAKRLDFAINPSFAKNQP
jgi:hypothetical protein